MLLSILFSCGPDQLEEKEAVFEIRNIGELSTTEYTIGKIVKLDDTSDSWYKLGDRKILIRCQASVKAGYDLTQIREGDVRINGDRIEITLPPVKLTNFYMDPNQTVTEMQSISGLRHGFTQKEKLGFMQQGEDAIKKELPSTGIYRDAEKGAIVFLKDFYKNLGFNDVIIHTSEAHE